MGFRNEVRIFMGGKIAETPKVRIPLEEATEMADEIGQDLAPLCEYLMVVGSIRRSRPEVGDIEFVALPKDLNVFLHALDQKGFHGGKRIMKKMLGAMPVEIYIAHKPEELGALTFATTGDRLWNVAMRKKAMSKGWTLNQYGLYDAKTTRPVLESIYEGDYFEALGVDWHEPSERSLLQREKGQKRSPAMAGAKDWSPIGTLPPEVLGEWQAAWEESGVPGSVKRIFLKTDDQTIWLWVEVQNPDGSLAYYAPTFKDMPSDHELALSIDSPNEVLMELSEQAGYGHGLRWDGPYEEPL
jgi:hypothetical protein